MSAVIGTGDTPSGVLGILAKERTIAGPGFNRWLVPPAALAIHLCIGMAYGFSVFWLPLSKAVGINAALACPKDMGLVAELFATNCDWKISTMGWMYTLFFVLLGLSAALWGGWLERAGPRKAGVVSAVCWCGGLVLAAIGVSIHQMWLMWLGAGVIGGIGLGLGYISPVSTLIKWFPDRRGMATGMAIMGFGGGAMIGSPLAAELMKTFATPDNVGVAARDGCGLLRLHDGGCLRLPRAAERLEARRLDAAGRPGRQPDDHAPPRACEEGLGHSPVLARVDGAVHERQRRHRRDRHGQPDAAGSLRRFADRPHAEVR
jgi:hypothetical protein